MRPSSDPSDVVVVGAGIAGLTAAHALTAQGLEVRVLEAGSVVGGVIQSTSRDGFLFEHGPTTVLSTGEHLWRLIDAIGLGGEVVYSRDAAGVRWVWREGRLKALPSGPKELLTTPLLSLRGRVRCLMEPWIRASTTTEAETLGGFLSRRFGPEVASAFGDPFVKGVYAGDVWSLGVDAFPRLARLEREHGSVIKGLRAQRREAGRRDTRGRLLSFEGGLARLPEAVASSLGRPVELKTLATALARADDLWRVQVERDDGSQEGITGRQVVLATSSTVAGRLLSTLESGLGDELMQAPTPGMGSVALGYKADPEQPALQGFGFLVPGDESPPGGRPVLGALIPSSIFGGRAPGEHSLVRVMLGGTPDPRALEETDEALVARAESVVEVALGLRGPVTHHVVRWAQGIPQYGPGHLGRVESLQQTLKGWPGVHLAGNYLDGVGVESSVASGFAAAAAAASL